MAQRRKPLERLFRPLAPARRESGAAGGDSGALEAIWQVVVAIPRGRASTYGAVARAAGLPGFHGTLLTPASLETAYGLPAELHPPNYTPAHAGTCARSDRFG